MKIIKHIMMVSVSLFVILGIPFLYLQSASGSGETDAVTGASVIIDQPSGDYFVFINKDRRKSGDTLATWKDFFHGEEISYVFEDITCYVAENDAAGFTMAQSFQSRLPENQMTIRKEDGTLLLSKAENGKYDIIILSVEAADIYKVDDLMKRQDTEVCRVTGGSS